MPSHHQNAAARPAGEPVGLLAFVIVMQAAFILNAGRFPLTADEARYAYSLARGWGYLFEWLRTDNHPPLYLTFLKLWTSLFGIGELAMRSSNLLFTPLLTLAFFRWCRWRIAPADFTVVFLALALNPLLLFISCLAKYYVALALVAFLVFTQLVRFVEGGAVRTRDLALWGLTTLTMLWLHYLSAVYLAVAGTILLMHALRTRTRTAWLPLAMMVVFSLGFLPWVPVLLGRVSEMSADGAAIAGGLPPIRRVLVRTAYTGYGFALGPMLEMSHFLLAGMGLVGSGFLLARGLWGVVRAADVPSRIAFWLGVPALVMGLAVMWIFLPGHPDLSMPERISYLIPLAVLLAGRGLAGLKATARRVVLCLYAIPVVVSLWHLGRWDTNNSWDYVIPWRRIAADITSGTEGRVAVVAGYHHGPLCWYYLKPRADDFLEVRSEYEEGEAGSLADRAGLGSGTIHYFRATRESTPDGVGEAVAADLERLYGPPLERHQYVFDSPGLKRIKSLLRRGTGVETLDGKVELLRYKVKR